MSGLFDPSSNCAYCGGAYNVDEHMVPKSRGGSSQIENVVPACVSCNSRKGTRTPLEWFVNIPITRPAKVCVMCGGKLKQATKGPGRRYCSGRCRIRAWRIRKETGELIKELTR